jgi:large subunit ribosomal protein L3
MLITPLMALRQIENCQVTATVETERPAPLAPYFAVQLGASDKPAKRTTKQMLGHFAKAGVTPKRIVKEFEVTKDALIPVGMFEELCDEFK